MGLATNSYRKTVRLTDGGVFDNLGLATAWAEYKDILVSDGGQAMQPKSPLQRTGSVKCFESSIR